MLRTFESQYIYDNKPISSVVGLRYNIFLVSYLGPEGSDRKVEKEWIGLRFELLMKYQWFFRRVAAINQLEHPRRVFGFEINRYESQEQAAASAKKLLANKIVSAKAIITKCENELANLRASWNEIFPLEQHPKWQATEKKMNEKRSQLAMMERQLHEY